MLEFFFGRLDVLESRLGNMRSCSDGSSESTDAGVEFLGGYIHVATGE
jgi:hypothetical protein